MNEKLHPTSEPPRGSAATDWWAEWFNQTYLEVYGHRDLESAREEAAFASQTLSLHPGSRILDLCCGNGRHSRALRDAGFKTTTSLDYSATLLEQAQSVHDAKRLVRGDMRSLPFSTGCFDALVMFFTSFGYFEDEQEDIAVLGEIARVLAPEGETTGGGYIIDFLNPAHVRENLVPRSERRLGNRMVLEERRLVQDGARVEKLITICDESGERRFRESVRLYSREEMTALLAGVGLEPSAVYGDFAGSTWHEDSPRSIFARTVAT